jgi:hypothetical protein
MAANEGKDEEIHFCSVMIVNGYARNETVWKNNSRVKLLRLFVDGKPWCDLHLDDIIKPQIFVFPENLHIYPAKSGQIISTEGAFAVPLDNDSWNPKTSAYMNELKFEIIEVYRGDRFDDTCLTGIALDVRGGVY